ncbi:MAG TPA: GNAT family N-acetyltransferase, partial [Candidatus Lustribacter sp.]|nr:GNAT family N-acetyltransferase [Candidatus Lustribacter sp.]
MTLAIRPLDVHDDADCARAYEIFRAATAFERPHASTPSLAERVAEWRHEDPAERMEMAVAVQGTEIVGVGEAYFPLADNTFMVWANVGVEPHRRRQGIGGALMAH